MIPKEARKRAPERPERPELKPRSSGELLQLAVQMWGARWKTLLPITAAIGLPFNLASSLSLSAVDPSVTETLTTWRDELSKQPAGSSSLPKLSFSATQIASAVGSQLLSGFVLVLLMGAMVPMIVDAYVSRDTDRKAIQRIAVRRAPKIIVSRLLALMVALLPCSLAFVVAWFGRDNDGVKVGALLVGVLGLAAFVVIMTRLALAPAAITYENAGPVRGLRRSFDLSKGRSWQLFGALFISSLAVGIPASLVAGIASGILVGIGGNNPGFEFVWMGIGATVAQALITPVAAATRSLVYFDLLTRKEGLTLPTLVAQVTGGSDQAVAA